MFRLTLTKEQLLIPLLTVSGAVDKKQSLAILSNILFTLLEGKLLLSATDLEIEITASINCNAQQPDNKITIPAKKLMDIVRSLDDGTPFTLQVDKGCAVIKAGRSQFRLATLPADTFPSSKEVHNEVEFLLPRATLIHLIQSTSFAIAQNDARIYLNGLFFELDDHKITAVAADGHRMAICQYLSEHKLSLQHALLPKKGVNELLRLLSNVSDENVSVALGKGHLKLVTKEYRFRTALIEARFPPYIKAIPRQQDKMVLVERDLLKRALSRMMILAHEKSRAVILHIQQNQLTLIANNQEQEEAIESIEAETEGYELRIGVNASYLLDVLNFVQEGLVRLSMSTADSSILVESVADELYQYIIMPMRI